MTIPFLEDNDQTRARREHLVALRELVGNAYPNKFERSQTTGGEDTISAIALNKHFASIAPKSVDGSAPEAAEILRANTELNKLEVRVSARLSTPPRMMGKAAFVHLSDGVSRLQIYVRKADVTGIRNGGGGAADGWELFNLLDHGDFIGVRGFLFFTKTGELSVHVQDLHFLAKALLPMPDKMHGISDPEIRRRQRYADLIADSLKIEREKGELSTREVFERRSRVIRELRRFLDEHGYIEVETPMLTPKATGAAAKPFKTHHNALDIDLFARIAPELYLKRLTVGGFERVYELNRNFRNEGIDATHNPEFTMLEFYCAYMDVNGMMDFCEQMLRTTVEKVTGNTVVEQLKSQGRMEADGESEPPHTARIDFGQPFQRLGMREAVRRYWSRNKAYSHLDELQLGGKKFSLDWLDDPRRLRALADLIANYEKYARAGEDSLSGKAPDSTPDEPCRASEKSVQRRILETAAQTFERDHGDPSEDETARNIISLFEALVEPYLDRPTFIVDFPKVISPLSKASPEDATIAERFELFVAGLEIANGFSELNDPEEQYDRFLEQTRQRELGDEEAMVLDEDYIRALAYGMPPAAGIGVGIDRLVMLLTGKHSIRDVVLFPHMRPERSSIRREEE